MTESARIPVEIQLILNKWTRDARTVVRDAKAIDDALTDAKRSAKQLAATLNSLKSGKITLDVDLSAIDKAASAVRAIDGLSPNVQVQVDTSQIMGAEIDLRALDNFSPKVTVDVSVDAAQVQTQLNSIVAPDLKVGVTANEEGIQAELNSLKAPDLKVDVSANTSAAESDIKSSLDELKGLAKIQIALEVLPMAGGLLGAAGGLAAPILEADRALKILQGTTNEYIPDAERLISDIFINGWGESRQEVSEAIAQFVRLRGASDDLEAGITSTFAAAQVTGFDFNEVLKASDKLVANGLVPSISDANDLIVATFRDGGDRAEDLLDTLTEYSPHFAQLGIDGGTAMNLINQGLKMGTRDGDKLADTFKELGLRLEESVATEAGPYYDALVRTGLFDEAQAVIAGELSGAAFAEAAVNAANSGVATDFDLAEIFGTPLEDFGYDIFKNLDFSGAMEAIIPEDAAVNAAAVINDNLNQTLLETGRIIQEEVLARFGGLDGALATINEKAREFNDLLRGGVDIPDALEIVLEAPGLANTIREFESFFGNAVIELLTGFRNLAETLFPDTDVSGLDATIADLAARQLSFDVQLADDAQGVEDAVARALNRGVTSADIGTALNTAIDDALSSGDFNLAQQLIEQVATAAPQMIAQVDISGISPLTGDMGTETLKIPITNIDMTLPQDQIQEQIDAQVTAAIQAKGEGKVFVPGSYKLDETAVDTTGFETKVDDAIVAAKDQFDAAVTAGDFDLAEVIAAQLAEIPTAFDDALAEGNFVLAEAIAGALGEGELTTIVADLRAEAGETGTSFQAMASGLNESNDAVNALTGTTSGYMTQLDRLVRTQGDALTGFEDLTKDGIAPATIAMEGLSTATSVYTLKLQGQLAIAKDTWQDYLDYLAENAIPLDVALGGVPTVPGKGDGLATGGRANPGWTLVGEQGPELAYFGQGADVLNNQTSSALMGLISQLGGGGSTVNNYINVNVLQNNNSQAAGNASAGTLSAQLRGFAR